MRTRILIVLFFIIYFTKTNAQKLELGKVTVAELEEKEHPKDPSAPAAVLFEKGDVHFEFSQDKGFTMVLTVKEKIKIYKKEGYEWANKKVSYRLSNGVNESVSFSDAVTYNLVGEKIEKTKLKSDGQFDEKVNKYYGHKKITMPNIKEGSIIEYEYVLRSPIIGSLRDWNFQTSIPVNYSEYKTYVPEYYVFNQSTKGFIYPKITVDKKNNFLTINSKERSSGLVSQTTFSSDKIDYQETVTTYLLENIPAMKDEAFVNNIENYMASVSNELTMTKYPNSPVKSYSTDWESVTKTIYDYEDFGLELKKTGYFEDDINALIKGLTTREETIAAIYNYVKANVKWNDYTGYSCNDGVRKAYKDKTGNVAEINLMLTTMLRHAGFNANPVLVSTRDNGIALFPSRTAFNYVIAAVELDNSRILLDATDKFATPNVLPLRDLNWFGRLIRKDGTSEQVELTPKVLSREYTLINATINTDGTVDGKTRSQLTDHKALEYRSKVTGVNQENYLESLENRNNNIEVSEYVRDNATDLSKPIVETFSFKATKDVEIINGKIYFSPLLFLAVKENPFKQEVREYPVDFGFPSEKKFNITITIPEGYTVETLPLPLNMVTGDDIGAFKYLISTNGNMIQVALTSTLNSAIVPADYYEIIKNYFQQIVDKQNEKVVLKKI